jgi:hypothetical protein
MFDRGHLDHIALTAASYDAFKEIRDRLVGRDASTGAIDDLGPLHSIWFEDPDEMSGEVVVIVRPELDGIHEPRPLHSPTS